MELLQLRYFRAVAEHEHVGRAAADLGVAQPSVSRAVIRLERELGGPLFDRIGRGLRLNAAGSRFLRAVDRGLDRLDDGVREVRDGLSLELGEVAVAAETLLPVAGVASRFHLAHPRARLSLRQASAPEMVRLLARGDVDLCLASQDLAGGGVSPVPLDDDAVWLVVPRGHELAGSGAVDAATLAGLGFVVPPTGYWQRSLLDALTRGAGVAPQVACETAEPGATLELVRAGLGVTLLPDVARRSTDPAGVAWVRLDDPLARRRLELVWPAEGYRSATAVAFAGLAREHWRGNSGG